jgi:hypothetical protein
MACFDIGRGIDLTFQIEGVTDDGYLTTYSFPDPDLLESNIRIGRTEVDTFFDAGISNFVSLQRWRRQRNPADPRGRGPLSSTGSSPARSAVWPSCGSTRWAMSGRARRPALPRMASRRWPPMPRGCRSCWTGGAPRCWTNGLLVTFETALAGDLHIARQDADGALNDTERG